MRVFLLQYNICRILWGPLGVFYRVRQYGSVQDFLVILDRFVFLVKSEFRPKGGFVSKWVYKFWPAKNLCTYQDILHHIGGGQQQKNGAKSSKP